MRRFSKLDGKIYNMSVRPRIRKCGQCVTKVWHVAYEGEVTDEHANGGWWMMVDD